MPGNRFGICVEKTITNQGDSHGNADSIINSLVRAGVIIDKNNVKHIHIERIRNTYPVYDLNYKKELNILKKKLGRFKNLYLLGRCGTFWYNNMDHSIRQALDSALLSFMANTSVRKFFISLCRRTICRAMARPLLVSVIAS